MHSLAWAASRLPAVPPVLASHDRCIAGRLLRATHPDALFASDSARGPVPAPRRWRIAPEGAESAAAPRQLQQRQRVGSATQQQQPSMALAAPALARAQLGASESSSLSSRQHAGSTGEAAAAAVAGGLAAAALLVSRAWCQHVCIPLLCIPLIRAAPCMHSRPARSMPAASGGAPAAAAALRGGRSSGSRRQAAAAGRGDGSGRGDQPGPHP